MDYEKKYKEALKRARYLHEASANGGYEMDVKTFEAIFPELAESEDERIRKRIIHALHGDVLDMEETTKALAWLEKQVSPQMVADAYLRGCNDTDKKWLKKQSEHKPKWSKEDEVGLGDALWAIEQAKTIVKNENEMGNLWYAERWLKSIKQKLEQL